MDRIKFDFSMHLTKGMFGMQNGEGNRNENGNYKNLFGMTKEGMEWKGNILMIFYQIAPH